MPQRGAPGRHPLPRLHRPAERGLTRTGSRALAWVLGLGATLAWVVTAQAAPLLPRSAPAPFVALEEIAPTVVQEIRYAAHDNLTGAAVPGYGAARCWLLPAAAGALAQVQQALMPYGLGLKVFDCYRPQLAVTHLARWSRGEVGGARSVRRDFLPNLQPQDIFRQGYFATRSSHSRGVTVDVTLVPRGAVANPPRAAGPPCNQPAGGPLRDGELDMGTGYDCLDAAAHTANPELPPQVRALRLLLVQAMRQAGFVNYAREWWHFTLASGSRGPTYDMPLH